MVRKHRLLQASCAENAPQVSCPGLLLPVQAAGPSPLRMGGHPGWGGIRRWGQGDRDTKWGPHPAWHHWNHSGTRILLMRPARCLEMSERQAPAPSEPWAQLGRQVSTQGQPGDCPSTEGVAPKEQGMGLGRSTWSVKPGNTNGDEGWGCSKKGTPSPGEYGAPREAATTFVWGSTLG